MRPRCAYAAVAVLLGGAPACKSASEETKASPPVPTASAELEPEPAAAKTFDIGGRFHATGTVGDPREVQLDRNAADNPHSPPTSFKLTYAPGPKASGLSGLCWQNRSENWGSQPGDDLSREGYKQMTFWARGAKGGEMLEFTAGGINDMKQPYRDSFDATAGRVKLELTWKRYVMFLSDEDLKSVITGFCWVASPKENADGATFYLDDIQLEG